MEDSSVAVRFFETIAQRPAGSPALPDGAIGLRLAERLPARYAVHAAAGVRGRRAVVQPPERRAVIGVARGRPHVEQLVDRQLAVEDGPADEPQLALHVVVSDDLSIYHRAPEVGRQLRVE